MEDDDPAGTSSAPDGAAVGSTTAPGGARASARPPFATGARIAACAAVVAAALVGVAVGVAVERSGGGAADDTRSTPAVVVTGAPVPGPATDAGRPDAAKGGVAAMPMMYGGSAVLEPAVDLTDAPAVASGYRYAVEPVDVAGLARRVAKALGVAGEPVDAGGVASVGAADGTGPSVTASAYGGVASWGYSDPAAGACAVVDPAASGGAAGDAASGSATSPAATAATAVPAADASAASAAPVPCEPAKGGAPLSAEATRAAAERLLAAMGLAEAGREWDVAADQYGSSATAWVTVDGMRTPLSTSFWFDAGGRLGSVSGSDARLVEIPGYPLVGARTAVLRTQATRWSQTAAPWYGGSAVMPMAEEADAASSATATAAPPATTAAAPERDGRPLAVLTGAVVTVGDPRPGLAPFSLPDGSVLLLPAYILTGDDGSAWSVLALTDDYVSVGTEP